MHSKYKITFVSVSNHYSNIVCILMTIVTIWLLVDLIVLITQNINNNFYLQVDGYGLVFWWYQYFGSLGFNRDRCLVFRIRSRIGWHMFVLLFLSKFWVIHSVTGEFETCPTQNNGRIDGREDTVTYQLRSPDSSSLTFSSYRSKDVY